MTNTTIIIFTISALLLQPAQKTREGESPVRAYCMAHEGRILREFTSLLSIPNTAGDVENIRRNAQAIVRMMQKRGLKPQLLEARDTAAPPAIYGELKAPGATRTLVLYSHYDGQPAKEAQWKSHPWQPTLFSAAVERGGKIVRMPGENQPSNPEWRLYARSAADDKAGIMAILSAIDAVASTGARLSSNIKMFFEGEEEAGSPHLGEIIARNRDLLKSDGWIMFDGPVYQSRRKQVVFGVRGITTLEVTVYGANRPLHSGHYGNWAPNPAMLLARLLASMTDANGRITIEGFYDDADSLSEQERRAIAEAPQYDAELRSQLGLAAAHGASTNLLEATNQPSLNVVGLSSAEVGEGARNVVPASATATIDLRLVKGNDHRRQTERFINHIRRLGFFVIKHEPSEADRREHPLIAKVVSRGGAYNAQRTRMDLPISKAVVEAVRSVSDQPIVTLPTLGGSLPLSIIGDGLSVPMIIVPIANYDNNQHAENENLRLQNLWDGIEVVAAILTTNNR